MTPSSDPPARAVVAGIDGRAATLRAAIWAAREAARRGLPLTLVAATDPEHTGSAVAADLLQARRIVDLTVGVEVTEEIVAGPVGPALVSASRGAELLVLGARAPDGHVDETVGATTSRLMTRASCPVVVIPAAWDPERRHEGEVIVAADPADPHGAARGPVGFAADVAVRWGAPLLAAVVLPPEPGHREVARGRRMLDAILGGVAASGDASRVDQIVTHGEPAARLLGLIGPPSGLLVLGACGVSPPPGSELGPTCRQVVRWTRCPVAVIPPRVPGVRPRDLTPAVVGGTR